MSKMHFGAPNVGYTHSLRVTISIASGTVTVLGASRVAMRAVAASPAAPHEKTTGYWFEVRDKAGKLLYHLPLPHVELDSVEVFDDPKGGTIRRVPSSKPRKLELIVPDLPEAAEFAVLGPRTEQERRKPSSVLHKLTMEHLRAVAAGKLSPSQPTGGAQ